MVHLYILYSRTKKRKATWQRAGFQKITRAGERKGMKGQDQGETRIPGSRANNTYTRLTVPHGRNHLNLYTSLARSSKPVPFSTRSVNLLPLGYNAFIFPGPDVLQCALEVAFGTLEARVWFVFARLKVGVNELNEPIEILGRDGFVLLVEIIHVAVQNFDE
jgi:hypothetical protein